MISQSMGEMIKTANRRLCAELCIMRLCDQRLSSDMSSVLSRLSALEDRLDSGDFKAPAEISYSDDDAPGDFDDFQRYDDFQPEDDDYEQFAPADMPPFDLAPEPVPELTHKVKQPSRPVRPAPTPEPENTHASGDAGSNEWSAILRVCKNQMDTSTYMLLLDCSGTVSGNNLTIYTNNPFAVNMLSTSNIVKQIKSAVQQALDRDVVVRISDEQPPTKKSQSANDKLDALGKFGVTFE
jgi:DNA polymerase-3 subunit gamma/tau